MTSETFASNDLHVIRNAAASIDHLVDAILRLLSRVPRTNRKAESAPRKAAREISRRAAAKAAVMAGSLAIPPGPFAWLTVIPELIAVWKIQAQMVSDLAGVYGQTASLTKEHMVYCLFRYTAAQAMRDIAVRVAQRTTRRGMTRWVPIAGAVGVGAYAFYDTNQVAQTAIEMFEKE